MSKIKVCRQKQFDVSQNVICVDKNKLMLHKKVFHVNKINLMMHKKSISCRQKQDNTAQKKYFVLKKIIYFFQNSAPYSIIPLNFKNQVIHQIDKKWTVFLLRFFYKF